MKFNNFQKFSISFFATAFLLSAFYFLLSVSDVSAETAAVFNPEQYPWKGATTPEGLVGKFYEISLGVVAALAFGILIYGAILYSVSGAVSTQVEAREWISAALWGLVLLLAAYLILYNINPGLVGEGAAAAPPTPPSAPPPLPSPGDWSFDSGIENQLSDASPSLNNLLNCMRPKLPVNTGRISSISDSQYIGNLEACDGFSCPISPKCAHSCQSCHYGGGTGINKSLAVDFGDEANKEFLTKAAKECGVLDSHIIDEGNHIHISTNDCPKN